PTNAPLVCAPAFGISPDPPDGFSPMTVTFDMCATTGGDRRFTFDFDGDGLIDQRGAGGAGCSASRVYSLDGIFATSAPAPSFPATTVTPASKTYTAVVTAGCLTGVSQSQTYSIKVTQAGFTIDAVSSTAPRRLAWTSQLDVPAGKGQVVVNGEAAVY